MLFILQSDNSIFISLSHLLSRTLFSIFDLNVHLLLYAAEEKEVLFQLHTQTTGFLLLILLYLKLRSWRNPLPWYLPGQGMPSLVEQHSVRRPSRHDNKTLHVKCCFSALFFLYLLEVISAPVKWPIAVALLLQSEYFHDSFNLDRWIQSEFCSRRVLGVVIMWQMYRCRSRLSIKGRLHNQNMQVYRQYLNASEAFGHPNIKKYFYFSQFFLHSYLPQLIPNSPGSYIRPL